MPTLAPMPEPTKCGMRGLLAIALSVGLASAQSTWPAPPTPPGNPTTTAKVLLGQALFWDEQLSSTGTVACGTCHVFSHGGADPRALDAVHPGPDGVFGTPDDGRGSPGVPPSDGAGRYGWVPATGSSPQLTRRTSPTVINAAFQRSQFWDGVVESGVFRDPVTGVVVLQQDAFLENQIAVPPLSAAEMGHPGRDWQDVVRAVRRQVPLALASGLPPRLATFVHGRRYAELFERAFGSPGVDAARIVMAIAAYMRTLVADRSPIDLFLRGQAPFPAGATNGFVEFGARCSQCHKDLSTASVLEGPASIDFRNTGVRPPGEDRGRFLVTQDPADDGKFKSVDLRNVALRGPFFHNGSARTLTEVLQFYDRGGDFAANRDPLVTALQGQLPPITRAEILAFLHELTDPRVAAETPPFDRPRLFHEGVRAPRLLGTESACGAAPAPRVIAVEPALLSRGGVTVAVDGADPGSHAFLGLDVAAAGTPQLLGGVAVWLGLTPGVDVVYAGRLSAPAGPGSGHTSVRVPLPQQPGAAGQSLFGQWFVTSTGCANGLAASRAFELRLFR